MMTETTITVHQDTASPGHHTAQPTIKTDPGQGLGSISLNVDYFRSIPGILKLIQVVFGIICMACASPVYLSGTHFFMFVVVTSFISTLLWCFVYLLSIREALKFPINWILTELLNTGIITLFYFIAFIVQLSIWSDVYVAGGWWSSARASNLAAGSFGLFNFLAYGAGCYFLFIEWKNTRTVN